MKVGILTHYQVHNHGALLQMYGLKKVLENLGAKALVLTYTKNYDFTDPKLKNKYDISLKSLPFYLFYLARQGFAKTLFNFRKHSTLNKFKTANYAFAPMDKSSVDWICVGSDEVFSLEVGFNKMMYGINVPCKNLISYAPSFGQTDIARIKEKGCFAAISAGLKTFQALSVRDAASAKTVQELTGIAPKIVCDPVFLYGFEREITKPCPIKIKRKYLLIYSYDKNMNEPCEVSAVKKYAKKHNLLIVSAGYYHKWADKNINADPIALISLFKGAQAVVTDTFHGSVLSIITNRPFAAFVRPININKMTFLLNSFKVSSAAMQRWEDLPLVLGREQDWSAVNAAVAEHRSKGLEFLKQGLDING